MTTNHFLPFGIPILLLWLLALVGYLPAVRARLRLPFGPAALIGGWLLIAGYLISLWHTLGTPPMRSIPQTLLWAAFFLPLLSLGVERFARTRAHVIPAIVTGSVFVIGALMMKELPNRELMPALQSPWFAPHVLVYMLAYATLVVAGIMSLWELFRGVFAKQQPGAGLLDDIRLLVRISYPLLTAGMLMGAYWAKIAWGHYWGWDPKETAAFVSWAAFLIYMHLDYRSKLAPRAQLGLVIGTMLMIALCWVGVNLLPSAQNSVHTYAMEK
jgi:ABC-type transport system involved in cytochrome c biogenesis permease subunit